MRPLLVLTATVYGKAPTITVGASLHAMACVSCAASIISSTVSGRIGTARVLPPFPANASAIALAITGTGPHQPAFADALEAADGIKAGCLDMVDFRIRYIHRHRQQVIQQAVRAT